MIPVTKAFFPPIEEYEKYLEKIWRNEWLTNRGELVRDLELKLQHYLHIKSCFLTTNGTIPIQLALKELGGMGEIITTPFSYVATVSAIVWENCVPVFVDIDPDHLTINEKLIESAITERTTAILATHVFGNPCDVKVIEEIAFRYSLKVIYDAAHCFGVYYKGKSLFAYGDVSTCSFHATKVFHTGEGGAVFSENVHLLDRLFHKHNFGHNGSYDFHGVGINGKMSELQAAMGLTILPYFNEIMIERKKCVDYYEEHLDFSQLKRMKLRYGTIWNYSYFPVIFENEEVLTRVLISLTQENIFARRYFYPSLNNLNYVKHVSMKVSQSISSRILCLPLYVGLTIKELEKITLIINKNAL